MSVFGYALACALPAFCVAFVVTAAMRRLAPRWGLVDQPAARKVHTTPTPLGGGLGVVSGFVVPLAAAEILIRSTIGQEGLLRWLPTAWGCLGAGG